MMTQKSVGAALAAEDDEVSLLKPRAAKRVKKLQEVEVPQGGKRVTIILEENDNIPPTGQFIQVNGRGYMLQAGEPASVPIEIVRVLDDAVMSVPQLDPTTKQILGYRNKLRFPYRVVNIAAV